MSSNELIGWFADIGIGDRPTVGGKGGSLGELSRLGVSVPLGFVVRTAAFETFLAKLESEAPLRSVVDALQPDDLDAITVASAALRARVDAAELPADLKSELTRSYAQLGGDSGPVAIRSSATTEDAEDASFAGLQDTYLWIKGEQEVERKLRACWASLYSVPSLAYRRKQGIPEAGVAMAVVVQQMVNARTAGVMFTRSPTTGDRSVVVIEAAWGLGSSVVSGEVTPDRFVMGKITGEITVREIRDKHIQHLPDDAGGTREVETPEARRNEPSVSDTELQGLRAVARRIEKHYGRPQDIEWAIDHAGRILILQSRPETVWSAREAQPVAAPTENPLLHLMSVFGGKR